MTEARGLRWWGRRLVVASVVVLQVFLVIRAYWADHDLFGFQMFPESSEWQAHIVRVDADGVAHDVRDPWPGGYRWEELVTARGLGRPFGRGHADTGLASTLDFFTKALDWVARNTPADRETAYLQARVLTWENGRGPTVRIMRSVERTESLR